MHVLSCMDRDGELYQNIARTCTLYNTRRAARAVTELYEAILSPSGIHATQFPLLIVIKICAPASVSELAHNSQTDRTTLTRTLKPLQENGWIAITPGKDRRVHEVRLTAEGEEALARALPLWEQAQHRVQEQLGHERWGELLTHLRAAAALTES